MVHFFEPVEDFVSLWDAESRCHTIYLLLSGLFKRIAKRTSHRRCRQWSIRGCCAKLSCKIVVQGNVYGYLATATLPLVVCSDNTVC